jgi:hypothetical protein
VTSPPRPEPTALNLYIPARSNPEEVTHESPAEPSEPSPPPGGAGRPFTVRTMVLMLVVVVGGVIGVLTYLAGQPIPAAIVAGMVSAGATFAGAHRLVGED